VSKKEREKHFEERGGADEMSSRGDLGGEKKKGGLGEKDYASEALQLGEPACEREGLARGSES